MPVIDSTAVATIEGFVRNAQRRGATVYIAGAKPPIRRALMTHGVRPPRVRFRSTAWEAIAAVRMKKDGAAEAEPLPATA